VGEWENLVRTKTRAEYGTAQIARAAGVALSALIAATAGAQPVFTTTPQWQSTDMQISTGAAVVDLNRDGWPDLVVSNGNDILRQRVVVYYGTGSGTLQASPGWQSGDIAFHGHLDVADVNADGWPDVAVAVLLAQGGTSAKLYLNNNGTLSSLPGWTAPISADSFGVAFGDMDLDGRPDLAVASGEAYNVVPKINAVYRNVAGALSATPSWQTPTPRNFNNCLWLDADDDGYLDLAYGGSNTDSFVFRNLGGASPTLETAPTYSTLDSRRQFSLMIAAGDVTGDGRVDLLLADNNQLFAGSGRFRQYNGLAGGFFGTTAAWTYLDGYTSALTLGDLDRDGDLDVVAGEWFGRTRYFLNTGAGFGVNPDWTSTGNTTTVERLVLADVNKDGLKVKTTSWGPTTRRLFQLPEQPIERIVAVELDGVALGPSEFTFGREVAWVSVARAPAASLKISYVVSRSLDMAVSNWDDNRPNQLYVNQLPPPCRADYNEDGQADFFDYLDFAQDFDTGDWAADFNLDGQVDFFDYLDFAQAFAVGCA
jgi:hypothetical protein